MNKLATSMEDLEDVADSSLGRGFFGIVKRMVDKRTREEVAVKVVPKALVQRYNLENQIRKEIELLEQVHHPNIIRLHFYDEDTQNFYIAMECAKGGGLFPKLRDAGKFSPSLSARYVRDVLLALEYLHLRPERIVHRDVKPENLLLGENDAVKLADFGWSNTLEGPEGNKARNTFCGTLDYLAPEMIKGSGHREALDCWSVGVLLFEFLSGKSPFAASTTDGVYTRILQREINWPAYFPPEGKDLIEKLLAVDPDKRLSVSEALKHPFFERFGPPIAVSSEDSDKLLSLEQKLAELELILSAKERTESRLRAEKLETEKRAKQLEAQAEGSFFRRQNLELEAKMSAMDANLKFARDRCTQLERKLRMDVPVEVNGTLPDITKEDLHLAKLSLAFAQRAERLSEVQKNEVERLHREVQFLKGEMRLQKAMNSRGKGCFPTALNGETTPEPWCCNEGLSCWAQGELKLTKDVVDSQQRRMSVYRDEIGELRQVINKYESSGLKKTVGGA